MNRKSKLSLPGDRLVARKLKQATEKDENLKGTKSSVKRSGGGVLRDLLTGGAGAVVGAFVGRPSFLLGAATTFGGYLSGSQAVANLGLGMMLATGFNNGPGSGTNMAKSPTGKFHFKTEMQNGLTRILNIKDAFTRKIYLDKLMKKSPPVAGLGFTGGDPFLELDRIEAQTFQAAEDYQRATGSEEEPPVYFESDEDLPELI